MLEVVKFIAASNSISLLYVSKAFDAVHSTFQKEIYVTLDSVTIDNEHSYMKTIVLNVN